MVSKSRTSRQGASSEPVAVEPRSSRPTESPYAGPKLHIQPSDSAPGPVYEVPIAFVDKFPHLIAESIADAAPSKDRRLVLDVTPGATHVLTHFLFTSAYQPLQPTGASAEEATAADFTVAVQVYKLARQYALSPLERLAKKEVQYHGRKLDANHVLRLMIDTFHLQESNDGWLRNYLKSLVVRLVKNPPSPAEETESEDAQPFATLLANAFAEVYHKKVSESNPASQTDPPATDKPATVSTPIVESTPATEEKAAEPQVEAPAVVDPWAVNPAAEASAEQAPSSEQAQADAVDPALWAEMMDTKPKSKSKSKKNKANKEPVPATTTEPAPTIPATTPAAVTPPVTATEEAVPAQEVNGEHVEGQVVALPKKKKNKLDPAKQKEKNERRNERRREKRRLGKDEPESGVSTPGVTTEITTGGNNNWSEQVEDEQAQLKFQTPSDPWAGLQTKTEPDML